MSWKSADWLVAVSCLLILAALQPARPRRTFCPRFWCLGRLVRKGDLVHCTRCDYSRPALPLDTNSPPNRP